MDDILSLFIGPLPPALRAASQRRPRRAALIRGLKRRFRASSWRSASSTTRP